MIMVFSSRELEVRGCFDLFVLLFCSMYREVTLLLEPAVLCERDL